MTRSLRITELATTAKGYNTRHAYIATGSAIIITLLAAVAVVHQDNNRNVATVSKSSSSETTTKSGNQESVLGATDTARASTPENAKQTQSGSTSANSTTKTTATTTAKPPTTPQASAQPSATPTPPTTPTQNPTPPPAADPNATFYLELNESLGSKNTTYNYISVPFTITRDAGHTAPLTTEATVSYGAHGITCKVQNGALQMWMKPVMPADFYVCRLTVSDGTTTRTAESPIHHSGGPTNSN